MSSHGIVFNPKRKLGPPRSYVDLSNRIVNTKEFSDALEFVLHIIQETKQVIINGLDGVGKRTLIEVAKQQAPKSIQFVHINPANYSDDLSAHRDVEESIAKSKKNVVILEDFEIFCRQKQMLLYNVNEMATKGLFSLIGLTGSQDCTEHLEKRVRSRLSASFYELKLPYDNSKGYIEFASKLVGGYEFSSYIEQQLKDLYILGNQTIRELKRFLLSKWDFEEDKILESQDEYEDDESDESSKDRQAQGNPVFISKALDVRIESLTRSQLELLVIIMAYCYESSAGSGGHNFSLMAIKDYALRKDLKSFAQKVATSKQYLRHLSCLQRASLVKARKPREALSAHAKFSPILCYRTLKNIIERNPKWQSEATKAFLRKR